MQIVVNNTNQREDLREKVLVTMKKQVLKKFYGAEGRIKNKPNCDAPFIVHNNIQQ